MSNTHVLVDMIRTGEDCIQLGMRLLQWGREPLW